MSRRELIKVAGSRSTNNLLEVSLIALLLAVTVAVLAYQQSARAQVASTGAFYAVKGLGTLGGKESRARDINEAGQVVGESNLPMPNGATATTDATEKSMVSFP